MLIQNNFLRIIFAGTSNFSVYHLNTLISSGHKIVGVLTQPDRPAGRTQKITPTPVKVVAEKLKLPVFQPLSFSLKENQRFLIELNADLMVVVAYGLILPKSILTIPRFGCINVHPSLLPRWRGAAPIQRSLLAGDTETGISIIQMDVGLDTGDIIYKLSCPISENDTTGTLCYKLAQIGSLGLIKILSKISSKTLKVEKQDNTQATYAKKLNKQETRINWSFSATQLERCTRAFNPWPKSWFEINKKKIIIWKASVIKDNKKMIPGTIIEKNKKGIQIATAKDILNLEVLQLSGRKPMNIQDFLNSNRKWFIPGNCLD